MTSRHGLQTLHTGANPVVDIVFVHGIFGHPRETWTSHKVDRAAEQASALSINIEAAQSSGVKQGKKSKLWRPWKKEVIMTGSQTEGSRPSMTEQIEAENSDNLNESGVKAALESVYWPADLLPTVLPESRILTWGYDVDINHLFSSASQATVFQHAETLLSALADERGSPQERARPLVFVAHSLGGIVVKDMLNTSRNEQHEYLNEILSTTYGIVFLGTPHRGSATASLGTIAQGITKAFLKSPNTSVLRDLKVNSQTLDRIGRGFSQILVKQPIKVHSFREELPTNGVMIVDSFSSAIEHGLEIRGLIPVDHRRMTKFSGLSDLGFKRVSAVLIRWAREIVETREESQAPHEETALEEPPFMVPFERDPDFTGREEILAKVEKGFRLRRRSALVGLGGVGKSQIAIEYAYRLRDSSPSTTILWAHGGDQERFRESYRTIADALKLPGRDDRETDSLALVKQRLCSAESGTWLLIVDNVEDLTVFTERTPDCRKDMYGRPRVMLSLSSYIPNYKNGSILITSRSRSAALQLTTAGTCLVDVSSMSKTEATKLLNLKVPEDGSSAEDFEALAAAMEYLPLAITQAAAYVSMGNTVSGYLSLFRNGETSQLKLLQKEFKDIRRDEQIPNYAVLFTWTTSFELIQARNPSATDLLSFMSVLHRQEIPKSLLSKVTEDAHDLNDNLMALIEYSLISARIDNKSYDIHRFVQLATRLWLARDGVAQKYWSQALASLAEAFPAEQHEPQSWSRGNELLPHVNEVRRYEFHDQAELLELSSLLHSLGIYLYSIGLSSQSRAPLEQAVSIRTELFGHLDRTTILSQMALSSSLLSVGFFEASEEIAQRIVDLVKPKVRGCTNDDDQIFWAQCISHLATVLHHRGRYAKAECLVRRALILKEVALGVEHEDTLASVQNLGMLLLEQGKHDEGEAHILRVLNAPMNFKRPSHLYALLSDHNIGAILDQKRPLTAANKALSKRLVRRAAILNEKHPTTQVSGISVEVYRYHYGKTSYLETLKKLGHISASAIRDFGIDYQGTPRIKNTKTYIKQGDYDEVLRSHLSFPKVQSREQSHNYYNTLRSLHTVASALYLREDFEQADNVCEKALIAREVNLGSKDLGTLATMRLRLRIFRAQNRHERVLQLKDHLLERHESVLGPKHAEVLWILNQVGHSLIKLRRFAEAEQVLHRVYKSYQQASDMRDHYYRKFYINFTTALEKQRKFAEMEDVSRVSLSRQGAKLGDEHESTMLYRLGVVTSLRGLGRFAEAVDVQLQNLVIAERENGVGRRRTYRAMGVLLKDLHKDPSSFQSPVVESLLRWRLELSQVQRKDACDGLVGIARVFGRKMSQHAEESYSTALKLKEKLYGPEEIGVMELKLDLGWTVFNQGKYSEAAIIFKKCVQSLETQLGGEHPITLEAYEASALALSASGVANEAEVYARTAMLGSSKVCGETDKWTLSCRSTLGWILGCAGKYTESEEVLRLSLAQHERLLKREKGEISRSQTLLAITVGALGKHEEAEQLAHAAFEGASEELGSEHPCTFKRLSVWARMSRLQGKYSEAEKLGQQALNGQLRVLREQHPETLTTLMELAHIYRAQGREEFALKTARDKLDGRRQMLGRQHPSTLEVRSFLGIEAEAPQTTSAAT